MEHIRREPKAPSKSPAPPRQLGFTVPDRMNHDPDTVVSEVAFSTKLSRQRSRRAPPTSILNRRMTVSRSDLSRQRSPQKLTCCYDSDFSGRGDHSERAQGTVGAEARP